MCENRLLVDQCVSVFRTVECHNSSGCVAAAIMSLGYGDRQVCETQAEGYVNDGDFLDLIQLCKTTRPHSITLYETTVFRM